MAEAKEWNKESILELISVKSQEFGVSEDVMVKIVTCENPEFNPLLQSYVKNPKGGNGREDSWGLSQIHLPSHPSVSKAQAQDPVFAIEFLAKNLKKGKGKMWACARKLGI